MGIFRIRARQARMLLVPIVRSIPSAPYALAAGLAAAVVGYEGRAAGDPGAMAADLRTAALLLAAVAGFALEDPTIPTTSGTPATVLFRRALRVAVHVGAVALVWTGAILFAAVRAPGTPLAALTLEAGALTALAIAVAGSMLAAGRTAVGQLTVPAMLAFRIFADRLPQRWTLFGGFPGSVEWNDAHLRWSVIAVVCAAVAVHHALDPARRPGSVRRGVNRARARVRQGV